MKVKRYKCPICEVSSDTLEFEAVEKFWGYVDTDGGETLEDMPPDRQSLRYYCPACNRQMVAAEINNLIIEEEM